jgi:glycosyltransferase involved in cell wall biosynthesis
MTLSIVTINFNNLEGLRKTTESVLSQTWHDYEWIIIDGGSTDGSKEFIEETVQNLKDSEFNPLTYWCSEPDKGIYNAMNKGITKANGEYVNFMNSGDKFYEINTLQGVFYKKHNADILYGDGIMVTSDKQEFITYPNPVSAINLYHSCILHQAMFVKTNLMKDGGFDESYKICADHAKWVELMLKGAIFEHINQTICIYDGNGISTQQVDFLFKEIDRIQKEKFPQPVRLLIEDYKKNVKFNPYLYKIKEIIDNGGFTFKLLRFFISLTDTFGKIKSYAKL